MGYRKIRVLLKGEGWNVGKKLVYRLYREERPGKPTDNAYVESFNGTLRAECLDVAGLRR